MKIENLEKLSQEEMHKIEVGTLVTTLMSAIPLIFGVINSVVGLVKSVNSAKGEIKTSDTTYKWESKASNISSSEAMFLNF
ncbi:hypothetical protein [Mycoplasmopsis alligatoris]|uniref:Uncharacterized protein n=1 Tax=Mycoplasmopsis alligatoris A21JP2 TaxID=747682 RepID=D4XVU7_9BACT|nr:hypothetical protein [Mycoplasmopsis alligatoris]EFF41524.1 conserved hypothetical protein [Mycoplasmopsis alligatoris A21JP2]